MGIIKFGGEILNLIKNYYNYNLDGLNEYVDCSNGESLNFESSDTFSIGGWYKFTDTSDVTLFSKFNGIEFSTGYYLRRHPSLGLLFTLISNIQVGNNTSIGVRTNDALSPDVWYNIVCTTDGTATIAGLKIYINGVVQGTTTHSNNLSGTIKNTEPYILGGRGDGAIPFDGLIDEVSVWNKELSQSEITAIYNKGRIQVDYSDTIIYPNCVSHWKMGENDTFYDYLNFDGVNEKVTMGNVLDKSNTDTFSFVGWINVDVDSLQYIMAKGQDGTPYRGYNCLFNTGGSLRVILRNTVNTSQIFVDSTTTAMAINTWYHVAFTYDGNDDEGGLKLYINGLVQAKSVTTNNLSGTLSNSENFQLGVRGTSFDFNGDMDEVAMFSSELSQADITNIYELGRSNPDYSLITGIESHWRMDNSVTVTDIIGSNDGTTVNMDSTNVSSKWDVIDEKNINNGVSVNMDSTNRIIEPIPTKIINSIKNYYYYYYNFDGVNEYIGCGTDNSLSFQYNDTFTYSAWVNRKTSSSLRNIMGRRLSGSRGIQMYFNGTTLYCYLRNTGTKAILVKLDSILTLGEMYHITFTYDGSTNGSGVTIYVNGVNEAVTIITDGLGNDNITITTPFQIGAYSNGTSPFLGDIDEVSVWDTELSQSEINEIYNKGRIEVDYSDMFSYQDNCISHWKMGENDTFYDYLTFDGVNEYIDFGNDTSLDFNWDDPFSFEGWININTIARSRVISKNRASGLPYEGFEFEITATGQIRFGMRTVNSDIIRLTSVSTFSSGQWYHVVLTNDGSGNSTTGMKAYIDGVLEASPTYINDTMVGTSKYSGNFQIGVVDGLYLLFDGKLDKFKVYNDVLTQSEVTANFNRGRAAGVVLIGNEVSQWEMDDYTTVTDVIGSNDGTTANMDSTNVSSEWDVIDEKNINNGVSVNMDITNRINVKV